MLKRLQIRDLAVIERLELEFRPGMTVLTGETGAGKSILIDALGLALGERADTSVVRSGAERAEVTAAFAVPADSAAARILARQCIPTHGGNEFTIRRVVNRDGGSRAYLGVSAVPAQALRELGENLIDIHGQQANQSMFKGESLIALLDHYGGHGAQAAAVRELYDKWRDIGRQLQPLSGGEAEFSARVSLLEYQARELEELAAEEGEAERLEAEHKRLSNIKQLLTVSQNALDELSEGDHCMHNRLGALLRELDELLQHDDAPAAARELLDQALIQIDEAGGELRRYLDGLEQDPEQLREVEQRMDRLHDVARKHHLRPSQLPNHCRELQERLRELLENRDRVDELRREQAEALEQYRERAAELHALRAGKAEGMAAEIAAQLHRLGMPDSRFAVEVDELEDEQPHRSGLSRVEFHLSANPGQAMKSIRKVASGGELSRISLAIQVIAKQDKAAGCMIFDEVDAGIGGGTAEIVGQLLHGLAADCQILCVTHLPQVAAQGDNHLQVRKQTDGRDTNTEVTELNQTQRVEEIARMLGGVTISEKTRHHAMEMLGAGG